MERNRSVLISLGDTGAATADNPTVLRTEILNALNDIDIAKDDIEGIESYSKNRWYVVFHRNCTRTLAVGRIIELDGKRFALEHPNPPRKRQQRYTTVRVYGYPLEGDRETLKKALQFYGDIKSATDMYDRVCEVKTGVREVIMELKHQIPSFIFAGKYQVKTTYWGQRRTCRKCQQEGHSANECQAGTVCRECGSPDHKKAECPQQRCYFCQETGHIEANCPKYYEDYPTMGEQNGNEGGNEEGEKGKTPGNEQTSTENNAWDHPFGTDWPENETETTDNDPKDNEKEEEDKTNKSEEKMETSTEQNEKETATGAEKTTDDEQTRKQNNTGNMGENPKNGNSPENASDGASSGVTPSETQTKTTKEKAKENQQKESQSTENPLKESQTKQKEQAQTEKPKETEEKTNTPFKIPQKREESRDSDQTTEMSETDGGTTTDTDMDSEVNKKREREQTQTPEKDRKKKKKSARVSQARIRNPFYK